MSPLSASARLESIHILVVGDDSFAAVVPFAELAAVGHDVRRAPDTETALRALAPGAFDIVIAALSAPGADGLALSRAIRAHPRLASTRVFIIGESVGRDSLVRVLGAGCDRYTAAADPPQILLAMVESSRRSIVEKRIAQRVAAQQKAIRRVVTAVATGLETPALFDLCAQEVASLLGVDAGAVFRFENRWATPVGWFSPNGNRPKAPFPLERAALLSQVQRTGAPGRVDDYEELRDDPMARIVTGASYRCSVGAPVLLEGRVWGAVLALAKGEGAFPPCVEGELSFFAEALALSVVRDESRTEREALTTELRRVHRLEAVGALAAGVAHEINTPIQFVGNSIDFLEEAFGDLRDLISRYRAAVEDPTETARAELAATESAVDLEYILEKVPEAIGWSQEGVARVTNIVRAMKSYAHQSGDQGAPADLNQAILASLTIASNEIKQVADVRTDLAPLPLVHCNIGDINQVILNLVLNAGHAIADSDRGGRGTIRVSTALEGESVAIVVADSGCGIPADIQERVFDPFFTTKELGRGTGQGLALAWSIVVDGHGGSLTFETEPGLGTSFCARLPLAPPGIRAEEGA
jgi:signal transduction histidine kinase